MMIKITLKLARSTRDCLAHARRLLLTYSVYAFYSFRDRKGRQLVDDKSVPVDGPRHSLQYFHVEHFLLSQVWSIFHDLLCRGQKYLNISALVLQDE